MFRLNRLTDYAVVVMAQMAQQSDRLRPTVQIAEGTGVPLPTVSKLMNTLAHAGLVESHRGANGGYRITRPADQILVSEIIQAIEGPIALTACVDGADDACSSQSFCPMSGNWNKVNQAIEEALQTVTLKDMTPSFMDFTAPDPCDQETTGQVNRKSNQAAAS
ncbi:SUF system Fe-S cluster assembly regulator [Rhodovibrionaceae bacterium A322]